MLLETIIVILAVINVAIDIIEIIYRTVTENDYYATWKERVIISTIHLVFWLIMLFWMKSVGWW